MEAWTLKKNSMDRLEAFEVWTYRRILKVNWVDRVTHGRNINHQHKQNKKSATSRSRNEKPQVQLATIDHARKVTRQKEPREKTDFVTEPTKGLVPLQLYRLASSCHFMAPP